MSVPVARSARRVRHGPPLWLIAAGVLLAGTIVVGTIVVGGLLLRKSAGGQKGGMTAAASNTPPSESGTGAITGETPAATIPVTPTPLPETSYQSIALDSIANGGLDFASPPAGQVTFGEIPFTISEQVLKTQASPSPDNKYATTATLTMNIERAVRLHILIGSGNGFTQFNHKQVGDILVECSGSWVQAVSLELGQNIREWHSVGSVVSSAPDVREVWSGPLRDHPSLMGHIDLLAVGLPEPCYDGTLTGVRIEDISTQTVNSLDPALNISGLTIEIR